MRLKRECGISLETLQWKAASSRSEGRISWAFSSHSRILGVPLELRWDLKPACVASGKSSLLSSCEGPLGIPLQLVQVSMTSSRFEARTSVFLSSSDMEIRVPMEFEQESQALSRVETWNSASLSRFKRGVRLPVKWTWESGAFSRGVTQLSHLPSCFESILRVPVESVQGNHAYLE